VCGCMHACWGVSRWGYSHVGRWC